MLRQARNIRAVDNNLTGINGPYTGNGIQRGGFTGAVTSDDGHEIPGI